MPEPSAYLSATQRDGQPVLAGELYRETWAWLDARGVASFVSPRLIEAYAQAFARYIQCEEAITKFGLLGKHPTTGAAIASPFVAMSQSFSKQANVYWYEIYEIVSSVPWHAVLLMARRAQRGVPLRSARRGRTWRHNMQGGCSAASVK
ncbi:P27 family phage terminase small subunit [Corynebacterium afermentans]|nr:P27 family phage terminase small subunit [Corynebacterium afermentans]MCG7291040.1 P27 family phage terminase small subunit [Corynebacterium afermentans]